LGAIDHGQLQETNGIPAGISADEFFVVVDSVASICDMLLFLRNIGGNTYR
jgi:hypothetical protein